jgi:cytochrome c-type biogenesis protein
MPPALVASDLLLSGPLALAIVISAAAGLVSFFSQCCLPLVPGYLSYVAGLAGAVSRAPVPAGTAGVPTAAPPKRSRLGSARGRTLTPTARSTTPTCPG